MRDLLILAKELFDKNDLAGAVQAATRCLMNDSGNTEALLLRARIHYKSQNWGAAMNDYCSVLELEPENQEAKSGIEMAKSILGYFTPDMFNP